MEKYLNEYKEFINQFKMVGSSLVFLRKDGHREEYFTGLKSIENNELTPNDAIYRVASISKVIVAIGVLKLYEKGLVDLDLDISEYLGFKIRNPKYLDDKITIRMLMTQTSSINDEGDFIDGIYKGYDASNETDDYIKIEELLKPDGVRFNKGFTEYKPGTNFLYSNFGCGILACICENITGKYFTEYIKEVLESVGALDKAVRLNNGFIDRLCNGLSLSEEYKQIIRDARQELTETRNIQVIKPCK